MRLGDGQRVFILRGGEGTGAFRFFLQLGTRGLASPT